MRNSILAGFSEIGMQAVVNEFDMKELYHPTLFPIKQTNHLTWKSVENLAEVRQAADIVARGTSLREKARPAFTRIDGDLPKIAVKRSMDEDKLYEYDELISYIREDSTDAGAKARLVELWRDDLEYCYNAVTNRVEWLGLRSISTGKIQLTGENNDGVITSFDVDYQLPTDRKRGYYSGSAAWTNKSSAKPISVDFYNAIQAGRAKGIKYRYAFMSDKTFMDFVQTDEVIKLCGTFAQNALNVAFIPTIETVNQVLKTIGYLRGLQIVVIDQEIAANETTGNPFVDNVVLLTQNPVLGETKWKRAIDMTVANPIFSRAERGYVCLKKYGEEEPILEMTAGIANAFPVWQTSNLSMLMDVKNSSWNEGN